MIDKVEAKVLQIEQTSMMMRNEFSREKDNLGRLEITHLKNSEEFKNIVGSLQMDFGNRLEIKMTDMVNKILLEQEDRNR